MSSSYDWLSNIARVVPRDPLTRTGQHLALSMEEDGPPAAPDPDLVTPVSNPRQKAKDRSTRKSEGDDELLFLFPIARSHRVSRTRRDYYVRETTAASRVFTQHCDPSDGEEGGKV